MYEKTFSNKLSIVIKIQNDGLDEKPELKVATSFLQTKTLPHKQKLFLKITSLKQENFKVEEYIREFEQLQIHVGLDEESKPKIARFIKGLSPSIARRWNYNLT